ncbi:MAG: hypothetical protein ACRDSR_11995 [Pseudonocardiaceae bacterium]
MPVHIFQIPLVGMRVLMSLPVVVVLMIVLDVLVVVQDVCVRVRHIPVCVLMGVLLHRLPPSVVVSASN